MPVTWAVFVWAYEVDWLRSLMLCETTRAISWWPITHTWTGKLQSTTARTYPSSTSHSVVLPRGYFPHLLGMPERVPHYHRVCTLWLYGWERTELSSKMTMGNHGFSNWIVQAVTVQFAVFSSIATVSCSLWYYSASTACLNFARWEKGLSSDFCYVDSLQFRVTAISRSGML